MRKTCLYIWLQMAVGLYSKLPKLLFEKFDDIEALYACDDFSFLGAKHESVIKRLEQKDTSEAYEIAKRCFNLGVETTGYLDERYPKRLKEIENPPAALYSIGKFKDLNSSPCVGIVGTRNMTDYGKRVTEKFAYELSKNGIIVVSGLAKGIDTAAHRGAVMAEGYTVAVLGNPIGEVYPKENIKAFQTLYERGLVLSELYPGAKRTRADFPHRNRIISGISSAVLVTEAGENSGSLITARHAETQSRKVFAIPGNVGGENNGTNLLIKKGVTAVTEPIDMISAMGLAHPNWEKLSDSSATRELRAYGNKNASPKPKLERATAVESTIERQKPEPKPSVDEKKDELSVPELIMSCLKGKKALCADEIKMATGLDIGVIMSELTVLEIEGRIIAMAGGRFISAKFK